MKTITVTTPEKAEIRIMDYLSRGAQKAIRSVVFKYEDVTFTEAERKFADMVKEEDVKKKGRLLKLLSNRELEALLELNEKMIEYMVDRIVLDESDKVLDRNEFEAFFDRMNEKDFEKLGGAVSVSVVESKTVSEKKTI